MFSIFVSNHQRLIAEGKPFNVLHNIIMWLAKTVDSMLVLINTSLICEIDEKLKDEKYRFFFHKTTTCRKH